MDRFVLQPVVRILDYVMFLVALLAIFSLVAEYGFYLSSHFQFIIHRIDILIIWFFVLHSLVKIFVAPSRIQYFKSHWFDMVLVVLILIETLSFLRIHRLDLIISFFSGEDVVQISKIYIIAFQITLVLSIFSKSTVLSNFVAGIPLHPAQILLASFFIIIMIGAGLLSLPKAVEPGNHLGFLDALFTSTSATCVTGLIVVDTGQFFSRSGQVLILLLIQAGGLGIMTYASFFALILRRSISIREKTMLREMLDYENIGIITKLLGNTVLFTLAIEAIGAAFLFWGMKEVHPDWHFRLYSAVFHSVSSFCNAGFSIYSDS
ncbi:MAG: potassium transporter TrkG, partial [Calditrichia bacterium]